MYGADDVAACLDSSAEGTVEVRVGTLSVRAYFDRPGADVLGGGGVSNDYALTVSALALPGLRRGDSLSVDGLAYVVADVRPLDDGALWRIALRRVT